MTRGMKYSAPNSLSLALKLMKRSGDGARVIGGGTDLKLLIDDGAEQPNHLVDVTRIREITKIWETDEGLMIGGAAPLVSIQNSPAVREKALALAEAASSVGSVQIRNLGTIGGNLANASPAADTPPALLALGARITMASTSGERSLPVGKFFVGVKKTRLLGSEIITKISIPRLPAGTGTAFLKFGRGLGPDLALVNVAAAVTIREGVIRRLRVALGAVAPTPVSAPHFEAALQGVNIDKVDWGRAAQGAMEDIKPITDVRTTEAHRKVLCSILLQRVVRKAVERARSAEK